eukprot:UN04451
MFLLHFGLMSLRFSMVAIGETSIVSDYIASNDIGCQTWALVHQFSFDICVYMATLFGYYKMIFYQDMSDESTSKTEFAVVRIWSDCMAFRGDISNVLFCT